MASSGGAVLDYLPILSAAEQASIEPVAWPRLLEFAHGRKHARIALAQLGLACASMPMAKDRSPLWPPGFIGSISHVPADPLHKQSGQVVAVVARAGNCNGLGVDLERTRLLQPENWNAFLTEEELKSLALRPVTQRSTVAHALWSAKEASMKAWRQPLEAHDIEIRVQDDDHAFVAECRSPRLNCATSRPGLSGRISYEEGWVAALAMW
jgi:4'-phosphopantetheinyl transferase EntD